MKRITAIAAVVFGFGFTVQAQTPPIKPGNQHTKAENPNWLLPNRGDFLWDRIVKPAPKTSTFSRKGNGFWSPVAKPIGRMESTDH